VSLGAKTDSRLGRSSPAHAAADQLAAGIPADLNRG
jgi:hypothetical protein